MTEDKERDRAERARIASKAQALAHKALREKDPEAYKKAYQAAKEELAKR
jgi:vacuolar-type H+-ATPase subunit E/Vma4